MMRAMLLAVSVIVSGLAPGPALALNIVITNDDGLTSNVRALHAALRQAGHDVIVSTPCRGQSGMSAAIVFARPLGPLDADCLHAAARAGEPGAGPMSRADLGGDFFYVDGTPVMAMLFGVDVVAAARWGRAPDLVVSGPNQGRNVGGVVLASGTIGAAQWAAMRGIPAIAFSAGDNTIGDASLDHRPSSQVAQLCVRLIETLQRRAGARPLLPAGTALNVNFPDEIAGARWRAARQGAYNQFDVRFTADVAAGASPQMQEAARVRGVSLPNLPGLIAIPNAAPPGADQLQDEAFVAQRDISVSAIQSSAGRRSIAQRDLRRIVNAIND